MQLLAHALLVAGVATAVMIGWEMVAPPRDSQTTVQAMTPVQPTPRPRPSFATVVKPFGASVRVAPSLDALGLHNVPCGTALQVVNVDRGWIKVRVDAGVGWISAGRVALGSGPAAVDCSGKRFLDPTADAWAFAPAGCLSLKTRPSPDADELACVGNSHIFSIVDGPFDPGTGEDWFKVTSNTTGTGWVVAESLYPL
jgi:hypothetical protein